MLIAHLSDPHLRPRGHLYHNIVDSNAMFLAAIQHLASLDPQPDLVILSGDLVDMGTEAEYALALLWHIFMGVFCQGHVTVRAAPKWGLCDEIEDRVSDCRHGRLRRWSVASFFSVPLL